MARARKNTSNSKGSTFSGVFIGLILGLGAALAVALFVTKAPMPFVDKFSREPEKVSLPGLNEAPDPNKDLYGKPPTSLENIPGLTDFPSLSTPEATPGAGPSTADNDELNKLIANLPAPIATPAPPKPEPATKAATLTYYLQAGAFRNTNDAEAMAARLLMLGYDSTVQQAQVNSATINRVRLGPFKSLDEMNRARAKLSAEKIDTSVVRP